jgi:predicted  nucleic acid-binding Zn-ribbon protein
MAVKKTAAKGASSEAVAEKKKATKAKAETATKEPKAKRASSRSKVVEKVVEPAKEHRFNFKLKDFGKSKDDFTVEEKLQALFQLQLIDSEIDRIRIVRGELPMEVADLEDEIAGLQTRMHNLSEEVEGMTNMVAQKKQAIKDSKAAIKKYEAQQMNVKNNREFDSLNKEIEFQNLEIQLSEKRIKEYEFELQGQTTLLAEASTKLEERMGDLTAKKEELDTIIAETQKEEEQLVDFSNKAHEMVEERLSSAYSRIRKNARNGLAVVTIQRDACGGCFNKIPPQRQLDIRQHKKIIVCEHCGRILIDPNIEI